MKGLRVSGFDDIAKALKHIIDLSLSRKAVSGALVTVRGPEGSFPWILASDTAPLERAEPLPPVMPVQGARALASFTQDPPEGRVLAVMRPCEARASIEVAKLQQSDPESTILLTMDCPGVVPLADLAADDSLEPDPGDPASLRPLCRQCTQFTAAGDISVVRSGEGIYLLPLTEKGRLFAEELGFNGGEKELPQWRARTDSLRKQREETALESRGSIRSEAQGLEGLTSFFSGCVGCRSCRTVCPVCYCRLCFIDMKDRRSSAADHLARSASAGAARLVTDTLLFHIGRMSHMSLSCVSCGMCEDACPSDIPVGRLMSMVSGGTSQLFGYSAGASTGDPLPLTVFEQEELHEYED